MSPFYLIVAAVVLTGAAIGVVVVRRGRMAARAQMVAFTAAVNALPTGEYIPRSVVDEWKTRFADTITLAHGSKHAQFLPKPQRLQYARLRSDLRDIYAYVQQLNEAFVEERLAADRTALDQGGKSPLTERQRRAVVVDENNIFVVAGAGTGKTSTIVGKVDYLTRRGLAVPGQILVLAFGSKTAAELRDRFSQFPTAGAVEASTFHALGRRIIASVVGKAPTLSVYSEDDRALGQFISN